LGEFQTADIARVAGLYKMASVKEVLDPTNRTRLSDEDNKKITAYQEWESNSIKSQLASPYNQLSLLTDAIDKVPGTQDFYTPTFDPELAKTNKKYILLEDGGTGMPMPKFTEEQTKAATEFLRAQTRNALDRKTKIDITAEPQPYPVQQWQYEATKGDQSAVSTANLIGSLYYGKQADVDAALEYFRDSVPNAKKVSRTNDGVTVLFNDGTTRNVSFKDADGNIKSLEMFIKGAGPLLAGQTDINTALQRGGYRKGGTLTLGLGDRSREVIGTRTTGLTPQKQAVNFINSKLNWQMLNQTESDAVPAINAIIQKLGFEGQESGAGSYITITAPNKAKKEFPLNDGEGASKKTLGEIQTWLQGNLDAERAKQAAAAGTIPELD